MKLTEVEKNLSKKQIEKILGSDQSKSSKMKELFLGGLEVKEISTLMNVRYNFVYNVVSNLINTSETKLNVETKKNEISKKDQIIEMFNQGKSNKEISIELKTNYNYVFNTLKQYKQDKQTIAE